MPSDFQNIRLSEVKKNHKVRITGFDDNQDHATRMVKRLRELGFEEGCEVEVLHFGPLGADPLAVQIEGVTVALRRAEACLIQIEIETSQI